MKRIMLTVMAAALLLAGCGSNTPAETEGLVSGPVPGAAYPELVDTQTAEIPFASRFDSETVIVLNDEGITVNGGGETDAVFTSRDIVYYEEKTAYESGNPYGEGTKADMHSAEEAAGHTVVNITEPGAYRVSGKLSAGQIRVDLGSNAYYDETAVVELILEDADITCTVAPAILFRNVYECDGEWSADTAKAEVDTSPAGAVLVLEGENQVSGSYVSKVFKDAEGEKKLWKQDGAIYSYMSMNVYGPGSLDLTAENEGLDTELHLTINGGKIAIRSGNDGINTNEDGVSVTTINAGNLHIIAGLGEEGDGIDSNGYLVINGGTVVAAANPAADAGMDSDMGSYVNGGVVIALGSTMDWAESDSQQVTMNLQFADFQSSGSAVEVKQENGTVVFAYDPAADAVMGENARRYQGAVISTPNLVQGCSYNVYVDGTQMIYTGADVGRGGFGGSINGEFSGEKPEGFHGEKPEGGMKGPGSMEGDFTVPEGETRPEMDFGGRGQMPDGERPEMPEGFGSGSTSFYMNDKVNAFSGVTAAIAE